jgi:hypothetical protein
MLSEQIESIDEAISEANLGRITSISTDLQIAVTYALKKALDKGARCRGSPDNKGRWRIDISPKILRDC